MKYRYLFIPIFFMIIGCGSNQEQELKTKEIKEEQNLTEIPQEINSTIEPTTQPIVIKKNQKTVTIYIHGYKEDGYKKNQDYGQKYYDTFKINLLKYTELPTIDNYDENNFSNFITAVDYYGNTPPYYYNSKDLEDIEKIDTIYGGGIPKYANIVAKFAKHILKESNASKINIVSVSMGSLVSRWLIEKDVENLISENKISKWITVEGVIRGNYALSQVGEDNFLLNLFLDKSPDTKHMRYQWIKENLNAIPSQMNSSNYKNIEVSQISLTNGKDKTSLLKYLLPLHNKFLPNDGFQLFKDTYFENNLSHTILYDSHVNVKNNQATFLNINNYLKSNKHIEITLLNASLSNIHEEITSNNISAEIVFESKIFSERNKEKWGIETPIDERIYKSGILPIYSYHKSNQTYALNQVLFNGFVDKKEKYLNIFLEGFEIDNSKTYDIKESNTENNRDSIGTISTKIELKNFVYKIYSDQWSGYIKVEMIKP